MDDPELSPAALYDAVMILTEGWVVATKPRALERWRRACERLLQQPAPDPSAREEAAMWIRGLFAHGRRIRG